MLMLQPLTRPRRRAAMCLGVWCMAMGIGTATTRAQDAPRANRFNDPFVQVTDGLAGCPIPPGPLITEAEMRAEAHYRIERGTSCYQAGRCRLPNAYLYDAEIMPRVQKAIRVDGRFTGTSVWAEGQRRWVWLKGCVRSAEQSSAMEQLVRQIDDVETVINQLVVLP
ncbi:BON domain-containing protein [uncultured Rhodoferax sp.]|uniref:BON domain-containing protein n=1 Tax=uncultured Rhodoferax sp. TaxID=223188 RepID=UPI0025FC2F39|nr:BON domain-containing protein [uncultured Rhodoferax sp.]